MVTLAVNTAKRLNVVLVEEELPYRPMSGKRIRVLNLLLHLAERHHITLISHPNLEESETSEGQAFLDSRGIHTIIVPRMPAIEATVRKRPLFYARTLLNLFSDKPFSAQVHTCSNMKRAIREFGKTHSVDLWQCEWAPYSNYLRNIGKTPWIMMAHDIQTCIWDRYCQSETNPARRWYLRQQRNKYHRFEQELMRHAPLTVTVTEEDAHRAKSMFGATNLAVVDNGVDVDFYRDSESSKRSDNNLLFLGSLDWRANLDAVGLLLDVILPNIREQLPNTKLTVVGRRPPNWLRSRIETIDFAELHGDVPDVRPYLQQAAALVVPLRIGGGSRLKILEALASGTPVVSTNVGAEGIKIAPGEHYFAADSIEHFHQAAIACLSNREEAHRITMQGHQVVASRYDWRVLADKLEQVWHRAVESGIQQNAHVA